MFRIADVDAGGIAMQHRQTLGGIDRSALLRFPLLAHRLTSLKEIGGLGPVADR